jgi:DNA invertase Pin-like site-specific DNA recombinase
MSSTEISAAHAVIYAAKSTADEHGSIPTQLEDGLRLAKSEGWVVAGEYQDEAASAYSGDRGPGLASAMALAEQLAAEHGRSALVVQHSDRLARGDGRTAKHLIEYTLWALKNGVRLVSVQDAEMFPEGDLGLLLGAIGGMRNHQDSKRKALAVKDGMKRRRAKGLHAGGPRKFGYDYVRDEYGRTVQAQPMRPNRVEALTIRRIYRDYGAGITQMGIQRALNAENVPTLRGGVWHQGTIAHILADPFYKGFLPGDGDPVRGEHEPIIDEELWDRVAKLREQARRTLGRTGGRPAQKFLFTNGHLRCGRCGGAMVPRTSLRKSPTGGTWGSEYEVYRCYTRIRDVHACDQRALPRALVDAAAVRTLTERGISVQQTRVHFAQALELRRRETEARLHEAEIDEQQAAARVARVERDYTDGELSAGNYERLSAKLADELDAARAHREQLERQAAAFEATDAEIDDATLAAFTDIHEAIAAFVTDARHLDQLRLRLRQLFETFTARDDGATVALIPAHRPGAIDELMADVSGLRREALPVITHADGLPIASVIGALFEPIPCSASVSGPARIR